MGCVPSKPAVEKAPAEPVPSIAALEKIKVESPAGEPAFLKGDDNKTDAEHVLYLIVRQIGAADKGYSFQMEGLEDSLFHGLQIHPANNQWVNIKKSLEDMVMLHYEKDKRPLALAIKNVKKDPLRSFLLLSPEPLGPTQKPVPYEGPEDCKDLYCYAVVTFDVESTVVSVRISNQGKEGPPLYTLRQCAPNVWCIKKQNQVVVAIERFQGAGKHFYNYRLAVAPGMDPGLAGLLTEIIHAFQKTAEKQFWSLCPKGISNQKLDWPPMDAKQQEKLFGKTLW